DRLWGHRQPQGTLALSAKGDMVAFGCYGEGLDVREIRCAVQVYSVATGTKQLDLEHRGGIIRSLSFSPRGTYLGMVRDGRGTFSRQIVLTNLASGKPLHSRPLEGSLLLADLAFNAEETRLAAADRDQVVLFDVATGQEILTLRNGPPRHSDSGFNPRVVWS